MEIKIPKDIRQHRESLFFGLSIRQFICSLSAVGTAVGVYFALRYALGTEAAGWLCMVAAAPLAVMGFFHYNGMTLEQFLWAFIKSQLLLASPRPFCAENIHYNILKGGKKRHDQNTDRR